MATTQTAVALFKGYTDVGGPQKFYLPIVEFNPGATVAGKVVLGWYGEQRDYKIGAAYRIEYDRANREVTRVIGVVGPDGELVQ